LNFQNFNNPEIKFEFMDWNTEKLLTGLYECPKGWMVKDRIKVPGEWYDTECLDGQNKGTLEEQILNRVIEQIKPQDRRLPMNQQIPEEINLTDEMWCKIEKRLSCKYPRSVGKCSLEGYTLSCPNKPRAYSKRIAKINESGEWYGREGIYVYTVTEKDPTFRTLLYINGHSITESVDCMMIEIRIEFEKLTIKLILEVHYSTVTMNGINEPIVNLMIHAYST